MRNVLRKFSKASRKNELFWRYGFNFKPSVAYKFDAADKLNDYTGRVLNDLNENGIAIASISDLLEGDDDFNKLDSEAALLLENRKEELQEIKKDANNPDSIGKKTFNVELLGSTVDFNVNSAFSRFALNERMLAIANAYLGMRAKLRYYNVWQTFATKTAARESQLWHYDREDNYILKVFLYLKDVDEGAGPFTYAPKTHRKGKLWGKNPEHFLEGGVPRSTDEQMAAVVPKEKWLTGIGKKGTIIFADTRGYHKGGEARTDDRLMYTCMYTSPASESKRLIRFPDKIQFDDINERQREALQIK